MSKREKPKTAVDTKAKRTEILGAKTEKPISKVTKIAKPKNPMPPSFNGLSINVACKVLITCQSNLPTEAC